VPSPLEAAWLKELLLENLLIEDEQVLAAFMSGQYRKESNLTAFFTIEFGSIVY
jgi:hypothetical protein